MQWGIGMGENEIRSTFMCPQITAHATELAVFGIFVREAVGLLKPRSVGGRTLVEIGALIVRSTRIDVIPRAGLSVWHTQTLLGAAERAFHIPPKKIDGWRYTRQANDPRWITWITCDIEETVDVNELAVRSAHLPIRLVA